MAINSHNLRYKAGERYGYGWTDSRGIFGGGTDKNRPFSDITFSVETHETLSKMSDEVAHGLWLLKFKHSPTASELSKDEFYHALAAKWWHQGKLLAHYDVRNAGHVFWPATDYDAWR